MSQNINIGQEDAQLLVSLVLPASGQSATTGVIDLATVAPNSNAWRMGRFAIKWPNLPENVSGAGITVAMQVAGPLLTAGTPAPAPIVPGTFAAGTMAQTTTIAAVAASGTAAGQQFQLPDFDATGSTARFYRWVVTSPAINFGGESITIVWVKDSY